jgi:hypothetical protein
MPTKSAWAKLCKFYQRSSKKRRGKFGLDPEKLDGIISMHLIENDPVLSKPITDDPPISDPGAGDWFVLIDATDVNAVAAAIAARFTGSTVLEDGIQVSAGSYDLMWDLAKSDIPRPQMKA